MPVRKKVAAKSVVKKKSAAVPDPGAGEAVAVPAKKAVKRKKAAAASVAAGVFEGEALAREAARYADDKKAENPVILDVRGLSPVTDYLVICDGTSLPHLRAIRNEVAERMKLEHGVRPYASHGSPDSGWMLVDFGDVVVHIFQSEKRAFYGLEDMWNDAPRIA